MFSIAEVRIRVGGRTLAVSIGGTFGGEGGGHGDLAIVDGGGRPDVVAAEDRAALAMAGLEVDEDALGPGVAAPAPGHTRRSDQIGGKTGLVEPRVVGMGGIQVGRM